MKLEDMSKYIETIINELPEKAKEKARQRVYTMMNKYFEKDSSVFGLLVWAGHHSKDKLNTTLKNLKKHKNRPEDDGKSLFDLYYNNSD